MFTLLQGFYAEAMHIPERRIVLLGTGSSGKTSILHCLKQHFKSHPAASSSNFTTSSNSTPFPPPALPAQRLKSITPTVGLNVARIPTGPETLLIWDLGGDVGLRSIWRRYVADAEALIWVVDASGDSETTDDSRESLRGLLKEGSLAKAPLLVFAAKQDIEGAMDPVKVSLKLDLLSDAECRPQCVQPCSSKTGKGVVEGIQWLVDCLRNPEVEIIKTCIKDGV